MRAVAQRVSAAHVVVEGETVGRIGHGLLVYLGAGKATQTADADWMAGKLAGLRVFPDDEDRMARDVREAGGAVLVVSQFTLYGDVRKGRRPSFDGAAEPVRAEALYRAVCARSRRAGSRVETGRFRAMMAGPLRRRWARDDPDRQREALLALSLRAERRRNER